MKQLDEISTNDPPYALAQRIEHWPLEKLIPYARNPRTHSETQVAQIAASIASFGFNVPILVDTKDGIIAGHGRLLAARKLELHRLPPEKVAASRLTDARGSEAIWRMSGRPEQRCIPSTQGPVLR